MTLDHTTAQPPTSHPNILLSVSNWIMRSGLQRSLEGAGHHVHVVGSDTGELTEQKPALGLISTDHTVPIGTVPGVTLCASQEVPVIWLSTAGNWKRPLQLGSIRTVGVLVQPVHETQLLAATSAALALIAREDLAPGSGPSARVARRIRSPGRSSRPS